MLVVDRPVEGSSAVAALLLLVAVELVVGCLGLSFSHYNIVAQKLGVNLTAARERGQLVFLEGLKSSFDVLFAEDQEPRESPLQFISKDGSDLKQLYGFVRSSLAPSVEENSWRCPVLLVDDLSVLLSLGVKALQVLDFVHYCKAAICSQFKGNVVALAHNSDDCEDDENELLVNFLQHQSNLVLQVEGLATGFCKDVHGQLKITWKGSCQVKGEKNQTKVYQYKIQDKNVNFFARGLSSAVL